jgi:hypothetical protein
MYISRGVDCSAISGCVNPLRTSQSIKNGIPDTGGNEFVRI